MFKNVILKIFLAIEVSVIIFTSLLLGLTLDGFRAQPLDVAINKHATGWHTSHSVFSVFDRSVLYGKGDRLFYTKIYASAILVIFSLGLVSGQWPRVRGILVVSLLAQLAISLFIISILVRDSIFAGYTLFPHTDHGTEIYGQVLFYGSIFAILPSAYIAWRRR